MDQARNLARRATEQSSLPLYGLPFAVKDSIDVVGVPTTLACPAYSFIPRQSATVVGRLLDAGAIFIGKTNLDQFATGLAGVRSPYGIPRNPFDPIMIPGGSSSGSAVAVSSGLVSFALATDTAGSGRVPAAFNNIVGYKPTRGLFSTSGLTPACRSVDCITLMGSTVANVMHVATVVAGYDALDSYSRRPPEWFNLATLTAPKAFRFGVPKREQLEFFSDVEAAAIFERALDRFIKLGGRVIEIDYAPWMEAGNLLYGPWVAERTADLGDFVGSHPDEVHPVVRDIIIGGQQISAVDLFHAQHKCSELMSAVNLIWNEMDFVVVPTTGTAYDIERMLADPIRLNTNLGLYTNSTNLLDQVAIAIPSGFTSRNFPTGITLIGPAWSDARLASYAEAFMKVS